jgi:FSR family fosmidomycin resistance protein-like MFS transporter
MSHALRPTSRRLALTGGGLAIFMALLHGANDALTTILSALLPTVQARFALEEGTLAVLVAVLWLSSSLFQPVFGGLAERVGRRAIAAGGIVASSAMLSLVGVVPSAWLLAGLLVVGGLGSGALHPVGSSLAGGAGSRRRELAVGLFAAGGMVGYAAGPLLILLLVARLGLEATPWLMVPGLALGALVYLLVPADAPHDAHHRHRLIDVGMLAGPVAGWSWWPCWPTWPS